MTSTAQPVPRWANIAAHLTVLTTLPSGLWRIPIALGFSMGMLDDGRPIHMHGWESVYVVGLSVVAEGAALLTLGLVRPWGERVPGWFPVIRGRRIPPMAVVVPAALGVLALAGDLGLRLPGLRIAGRHRVHARRLACPARRLLRAAGPLGAAAGRS